MSDGQKTPRNDDATRARVWLLYVAGATGAKYAAVGDDVVESLASLLAEVRRDERADIHAAVQDIVRAMWLYGSYQVNSRGPRGCLLDAIELLEPETAKKIQRGDAGDDWGDVYEREEEAEPATVCAAPQLLPGPSCQLPAAHDGEHRAVDEHEVGSRWLTPRPAFAALTDEQEAELIDEVEEMGKQRSAEAKTADEDWAEVMAMSDAEVDAELRAMGEDPIAVGDMGLVAAYLGKAARFGWPGEQQARELQHLLAEVRRDEREQRRESPKLPYCDVCGNEGADLRTAVEVCRDCYDLARDPHPAVAEVVPATELAALRKVAEAAEGFTIACSEMLDSLDRRRLRKAIAEWRRTAKAEPR